MMAATAYALTPQEKRDFDAMRQLFLRRPRSGGEPPADLDRPRDDQRPPIIFALLDGLNCGGTAMGAVLTQRSTNEKQIISAYGQPTGGTFKVGFVKSAGLDPEWTPLFYPAIDTAATLQKYLSACPSVGVGNVEVTLGLITTADRSQHNTWRWIITWCGKFAGLDVPMVQIDYDTVGAALLVTANNPLEDTGRVELIHEVIGVPDPSPLRAGARGIAIWHYGIGYIPVSIEIRDFGEYGLFS